MNKSLIFILVILLILFSGCSSNSRQVANQPMNEVCEYSNSNVSLKGCSIVNDYLERKNRERKIAIFEFCKDSCRDLDYEGKFVDIDGLFDCFNMCEEMTNE